MNEHEQKLRRLVGGAVFASDHQKKLIVELETRDGTVPVKAGDLRYWLEGVEFYTRWLNSEAGAA